MAFLKKETGEKDRGAALQVLLSLVALLLGILLTFIPNMTVQTLCYVFSVLLAMAGLIAIVYYFATGSWKRLDDYNFALGVMLLILGCCGLARIEGMAGRFLGYMGFLTLAIGIVELQNTVQLRVLNSGLWLPVGICALITLLGGIFVILEVEAILNLLSFWILIGAGVLGLISLGLTLLAVKHPVKRPGSPSPAPSVSAEDKKEE